MIYVDTSVLLAAIFSEDTRPADSFWDTVLYSSKLIEYEAWNRIHARKSAKSHGEFAYALLNRVEFLELSDTVLERALRPFPTSLRTLDALHLASADYLRTHGAVSFATYDTALETAARALEFEILRPG